MVAEKGIVGMSRDAFATVGYYMEHNAVLLNMYMEHSILTVLNHVTETPPRACMSLENHDLLGRAIAGSVS